MRFTKIRLGGTFNNVDLAKVDAATTDSFILKSFSGLGPVETNVSISATVQQGGVYQGRMPQNLEPVFLIGLNPNFATNETAADLRDRIYGLLTAGVTEQIMVKIMDGVNTVAQIPGVVKKLEIQPFSKTPEVQVTIASPASYLEAPVAIDVPIPATTYFDVDNLGTAPSGFEMEVTMNLNVDAFELEHQQAGKFMLINYDFEDGDVIYFDTRAGSRAIKVTRDAVETDLIGYLSADSSWLEIAPGLGWNRFIKSNTGSTDWTSLSYKPRYWGV